MKLFTAAMVLLGLALLWYFSPLWLIGTFCCLAIILGIFFPWWWPQFKVYLASNRLFYATLRENSALGRRRAQNTWMMYVCLTKDGYKDIVQLCQGYNPFVDVDALDKLNDKRDIPIRLEDISYEYLLNNKSLWPSHYHLVVGKDATVWIGWPGWPLGSYDSVSAWYFTESLKDGGEFRKPTDKGGDENHTIPLKMETTKFPLPITKERRKEIEGKVALVKAKKLEPLPINEILELFSLEAAETGDGFTIPTASEVDWVKVDPWPFNTAVEFPGTPMHGMMNYGNLQSMADLFALSVANETESEEEMKKALMKKINEHLQERTGMTVDNRARRLDEFRKPGMADGPQRTLYSVMARLGVVVLHVRLTEIVVPKELKDLLNQPAKERANLQTALIKAEKDFKVANRNADTEEKVGEGERRRDQEVAKGRRALVEVWNDLDPAVAHNRVTEIQAEAWREGVTKPGTGKVIITGAPGTLSGSGLEGIAASVAAVAQSVAGGDSKKDKPKKKGDQDSKEEPEPSASDDSMSAEGPTEEPPAA